MIDYTYTHIYSQGRWSAAQVRDVALTMARGHYQADLVYGDARLSGSELTGEARRWAGQYARSRRAYLARVRAAGIRVSEVRAERGRRVLVLGVPRGGAP